MVQRIWLEGVGFTYPDGVRALHDVSVTLSRDEFVGIVGANGSGKSTLAGLLQGRFAPTEGALQADGGRSLNPRPDTDDAIVVVGADPESQLLATSVFDEVAFALRAARRAPSDVLARTHAALRRCDLIGLAARHPGTLSVGEQLRVLLAAAVARRPAWLVLDEVGSMLDNQRWCDMLSLVLSLHKDDQMGLIVITHRLEDILDADRVLALAEGAVALEGTVDGVLARISSRPEVRVVLPLALAVGELVRSEPIRALLTAKTQRVPVAGASREP